MYSIIYNKNIGGNDKEHRKITSELMNSLVCPDFEEGMHKETQQFLLHPHEL